MEFTQSVTERRTKLYGPQREVTRQHCKSICTKDSVRDALQNGEYGGDSDVWVTSIDQSYKGEPKSEDTKLNHQSRNATNFVLGFNKEHTYMTTTDDYKSHGVTATETQTYDMDKSHIPDFCPEYAECRKTKPSEYQVSFTLDSEESVSIKEISEERKKHTNDLRTTHFQLGSCTDSKTSETCHSFCEVTKKKQPKMIGAAERTKSTVFRRGDWNNNDNKILPESVTRKDFCELEEFKTKTEHNEEDNETETQTPSTLYHRATHFQLGTAKSRNDSIYKKDFMQSPNLATCKPTIASEPIPAMVIANDSYQTNYESTLQRNFGNCDRDTMLELKEERKAFRSENKSRQVQNSVPISFKEEKSSAIPNQLKSTTTCHFHQPLKAESYKPYSVNTTFTEYNHLTGDYNGEEITETKASYLASPLASKELRDGCRRRDKGNKTTQFIFGNDNNHNDSVTEQASQYRQHLALDPSLRAAGKSLPQKKVYRHVVDVDGIGGQYTPSQITDQSESNKEIQSTSVMKRDYKAVPRQRVIDSFPVKTVPTHFFHMDNDFQGTQNSTTKNDFLSPEFS